MTPFARGRMLGAACAALLLAPAAGKADDPVVPYDESSALRGEAGQTFTLTTDLARDVQIQWRMSNARNDTHCKAFRISSLITLSGGHPFQMPLMFSQEGSPSRALYEWHVCVVADGVTYRAWRGFDPGPGSRIALACALNRDRLAAKDTDTYLCRTDALAVNPGNYAEYKSVCPGADDKEQDDCRRFDTKAAYDGWSAHNPLSGPQMLAIGDAVLDYAFHNNTYLSANAHDFAMYVSIAGRDPPPELLAKYAGFATLHPASDLPPRKAPRDPPAGMIVGISTFEVSDDGLTATGAVSAYCGSLCASHSTVTLHSDGGVWHVVSFKLDSIS